jgi:hypothetical protein
MTYYYLISSLPDISLQIEANEIDYNDTFDSIKRNLSKADQQLLRYLIYPNDIQNLISTIAHNFHHVPLAPFKTPAIFNQDEIKNFKLIRRNFPDFINGFLADNEDRLGNMSLRDIENALLDRFYNKVIDLQSGFLTNYYHFVRELKSLIAAYNYNSYSFLSQPYINDADRLILQVGPDRAPSALVIKDYPYLEKLIVVLSKQQPEETERFIDTVIWNYLDETISDTFSSEAVFAYAIKLQISKRRLTIKAHSNDNSLEALLQKIINNPTQQTPVL